MTAQRVDDDLIKTRYDEIVDASGDAGIETSVARDKLTDNLVQAVEDGQLELIEEGIRETIANLVDRIIVRERKTRSRRLPRALKLLAECIADGQLWSAEQDPTFRVAYGIGVASGDDKTLIHWSAEDLLESKNTANQMAVEQAAAAAERGRAVDSIITEMQIRGARIVGDLAPSAAS